MKSCYGGLLATVVVVGAMLAATRAEAGAVAYMLDGTTMNHFDPSGNTGLAGGWNNNGFVGAGFKIPEPSSVVLLGLALTGLIGWRKRS